MCNTTHLSFSRCDLSQSDSGSEKDYPLPRRPSPCQPAARFACKDSGYEPTTSTATVTAVDPRQADHHHTVDLDLDLSPSSQREEGEGWDREQAKRLEERNKWFEEGVPFSEMGSRWDSMELKRGSAPGHLNETLDSDVSSKWVEFETLSVCDTIGAQTHQSSPEEAEQPETASQTDVCSPCRNGEQTDKGAALQKEVRKNFTPFKMSFLSNERRHQVDIPLKSSPAKQILLISSFPPLHLPGPLSSKASGEPPGGACGLGGGGGQPVWPRGPLQGQAGGYGGGPSESSAGATGEAREGDRGAAGAERQAAAGGEPGCR